MCGFDGTISHARRVFVVDELCSVGQDPQGGIGMRSGIAAEMITVVEEVARVAIGTKTITTTGNTAAGTGKGTGITGTAAATTIAIEGFLLCS